MKNYLLYVILCIACGSVSCSMLGLGYAGYPPYAGGTNPQTPYHAPASAPVPYGYAPALPYRQQQAPVYQHQQPLAYKPPQAYYAPPAHYGYAPAPPRSANVAKVASAPSAPTNSSKSYSSFDLAYPRIKKSPYTIKGIHYSPMQPQEALNYKETGICSIYKGGHTNAIGEKHPSGMVTAAHKTLPLPCVVKVTNHKNGRTVYARVNDRGPFLKGRILDISTKGGELLGFSQQGLTTVTVEVVSVGDGKLKIRK